MSLAAYPNLRNVPNLQDFRSIKALHVPTFLQTNPSCCQLFLHYFYLLIPVLNLHPASLVLKLVLSSPSYQFVPNLQDFRSTKAIHVYFLSYRLLLSAVRCFSLLLPFYSRLKILLSFPCLKIVPNCQDIRSTKALHV